MLTHVYANGKAQWSLEDMFAYNVRYQVYCRNQEEKEYLQAMQLMFGRELEILCYEERAISKDNPYGDMAGTRVLPMIFTTGLADIRTLP